MTVELVLGRLDERRAGDLVEFWTGHGVLDEAAARARLGDVACVALAGEAIVGACSVVATRVELVGDVPLWVLRSFLLPEAADAYPEMLRQTFDALGEGFDPASSAPIGLCAIVPPEQARRRPEAEWSDPRLLYAGKLGDGSHVRVAYFYAARVRPRIYPVPDIALWDLESGPRIVRFDDQDVVREQDVVDFWLREGTTTEEEAARRVDELQLVALEDDAGLVATTTVYLEHNAQLAMPMWYARMYIAADHRGQMTSVRMAIAMRDELAERYTSGRDTRAAGLAAVIENAPVREAFPEAWWPPHDLTFIGTDARGHDLRVFWFPGATLPL